jgi:hypothetical protein
MGESRPTLSSLRLRSGQALSEAKDLALRRMHCAGAKRGGLQGQILRGAQNDMKSSHALSEAKDHVASGFVAEEDRA